MCSVYETEKDIKVDNLFKNSGCGCLFLAAGVFLVIYVAATGIQVGLYYLIPTMGKDAAGAVGVGAAIILFVALVATNWKKLWS
jgi:uncharacterized membrane protein